jgi:hypothetical protein
MKQSPPDNGAILEQLKKILASETFRSVPRQKKLLRFLVETTVAGHGGEIKGSSVAHELFQNDEGAMRSEASRLRAKLLDYYHSEGASDQVRIDIEKGGYVPNFICGTRTKPALTVDGTPPAPEQPVALDQKLPQEPVGATSSLWHLPYARNALFKGREVELEFLHDNSKEKNNRRTIQVLAALPGYGKTSIAVEYAYLFRKEYALVWWLDASCDTSLLKEYEILARALDTRYGQQSPKDLGVIPRASDRLSALSDWLLIFDGASSAENVSPYLPTTGTGHIVITATDRNWKGTAAICDVGPLGPPSAVEFLNDRLAEMPASFGKDLAPELASELSYIPAALDIASTYLEQTCCPIQTYLERLRRLRRKPFLLFGMDRSAELVVARTWKLTVWKAECESPAAYILLRLLEWLDDCEIPTDFIEQLDAVSDEIWGKPHLRIALRFSFRFYRRYLVPPIPPLPPLRASGYVDETFSKGLLTLQRYSIVSQSRSVFTIPKVVKVIMRTQQLKRTQKVFLRKALLFTAVAGWQAISRNDDESARLWVRHLRTAIQHAETLGMFNYSDDLTTARHNLKEFEERLKNPESARAELSELMTPEPITFRGWCWVLNELRKEMWPTDWVFLFFFISYIVFNLCVLGVLSGILYVHYHGILPYHGLFWSRICVATGLISGIATFIFRHFHHRLRNKAFASNAQDG